MEIRHCAGEWRKFGDGGFRRYKVQEVSVNGGGRKSRVKLVVDDRVFEGDEDLSMVV